MIGWSLDLACNNHSDNNHSMTQTFPSKFVSSTTDGYCVFYALYDVMSISYPCSFYSNVHSICIEHKYWSLLYKYQLHNYSEVWYQENGYCHYQMYLKQIPSSYQKGYILNILYLILLDVIYVSATKF